MADTYKGALGMHSQCWIVYGDIEGDAQDIIVLENKL